MGAISESGVAEDRDNRLRRDSPPGKQVPTHIGASKGLEHYCRLLSWVLLITVGTALWWSRSLHMQACAPVGTASVRPARDPATVSYMASKFLVQAPKVLCFGDSLTERGFGERGWVAGLAQHFVRRADIMNVGLGGYNSRWALQIVQDVLAGHTGNTTTLVTLWFGANDAALPNGPSAPQHVPVAEYSANLAKIVEAVRAVGIKHIVILTPPPVHDAGRKAWQVVKHGEADAAGMTLDRTLEFAQQYARAAVEAGKRLNIPVVELYNSMQQEKDWGERYLCDGLHFTPEGNQFVLSKLVETLDVAYPDLRPEALPIHYPPWDMVDAKNPAATFGGCAQLRQQGPGATSTLPSNQQL